MVCAPDMVQIYHSYIWTIVNNAVTYGNYVIDRNDLFQSGALALIYAARKNKKSSYLKASIRHAVHRQASKFYGCFTINHHVIDRISKCRKEPSLYQKSDPVYRLVHHRSEVLV